MKNWWRGAMLFFSVFAFLGSILLVIGFYNGLIVFKSRQAGIQVEGVVVELLRSNKNSATPVIEYTSYDGQKRLHTGNVYTSPPAYSIGERVKLWYDPTDPSKVSISGLESWFALIFLGGMGLIFGGIGYGGLYSIYRKTQKRWWLKQHGTAVKAHFTKVGPANVKVNGQTPFVFYCRWEDTFSGKVYDFKSDPLWQNPGDSLRYNQEVTVLIDPKNPKSYWIDLAFLNE